VLETKRETRNRRWYDIRVAIGGFVATFFIPFFGDPVHKQAVDGAYLV
jgi:hypothetical protein